MLYDLSMLTVATGLLKSLHPSAVTLGMLALLCTLWWVGCLWHIDVHSTCLLHTRSCDVYIGQPHTRTRPKLLPSFHSHICNRLLVHLQILVKPVRPGIGGLNDTGGAGERELVSVADRGRRESRGGSVGGLVGGRKDSLGGDGLGLAAESI